MCISCRNSSSATANAVLSSKVWCMPGRTNVSTNEFDEKSNRTVSSGSASDKTSINSHTFISSPLERSIEGRCGRWDYSGSQGRTSKRVGETHNFCRSNYILVCISLNCISRVDFRDCLQPANNYAGRDCGASSARCRSIFWMVALNQFLMASSKSSTSCSLSTVPTVSLAGPMGM